MPFKRRFKDKYVRGQLARTHPLSELCSTCSLIPPGGCLRLLLRFDVERRRVFVRRIRRQKVLQSTPLSHQSHAHMDANSGATAQRPRASVTRTVPLWFRTACCTSIKIILFPTSLEVSERAREQTNERSEAVCASKASSVEEANERMDEQVAPYPWILGCSEPQ